METSCSNNDTSVTPIFIAAGHGVAAGFTTERIIRQIDFAPPVAVLGGVRMPNQCEGAQVYRLLEEQSILIRCVIGLFAIKCCMIIYNLLEL